MLVSIKFDLQNYFEYQDDYDDNQGAERLFQKLAKSYKIYLISKHLFVCKMIEYNIVIIHVLILYEKM